MTLGAGQFHHRVKFQSRADATDDYGTPKAAWATITGLDNFPAAFRPQFAGERLAAGVIEGGMGGTLTVRRCTATAALTGSDRVVFLNAPYSGTAFNIEAVVPSPDNREIGFQVRSGGSTG